MKTTSIYSLFAVTVLSLGCVIGCNKEGSPPSAGGQSGSATKNSFAQTTARLDAGGDFYLYLSTEQMLASLTTKAGDLRKMFESFPGMEPTDREGLGKVLDLAGRVFQKSGLREVSGFGMSSLAIEKGVYRNKLFLHHYPGTGQGLLWTLGGQKPHALAQLDWLPANTALASSSDFDLAMLWSLIRDEAAQSGFPQAQQFIDGLPAALEQAIGLKLDPALASLGKEFGFVFTLDPAKKVTLPLPQGTTLEIPEPGLLLLAKTTNDMIFDALAAMLDKQGGAQVVRVDTAGLKMRTLPVPLPLPIQLRPTIATSGGYLLVATSDALVQEALAVKAGQKPGLKAQEEFKRLARGIPTEGNGFSFMSQRLSEAILAVEKQALETAGQNGETRALLPLLQMQQAGFGYSVNANTDEGWLVVGNANFGQARAVLMSAAVVPIAVSSAMLLPALAQAKDRAQRINCSNNLKQLCLAGRVWAMDHTNTFPPDLVSMKEEIASPKILVCPADKVHTAAASWAAFKPENCTYEFLATGAGDSEPDRVAFRCPIHSNIGLMDGSVQMVAKGRGLVEQGGKLYYRPKQ